MEGILLIDKPEGFTSFDVIAKLRGITKTKKIGHSGTLDPMATGVLPVFFGRAAKACGILPNEDKAYRATFRLGMETDTQDITGSLTASRPVTVGTEEVRKALSAFTGDILQVPPMYSAVKVGGKRLYALAREGIEVERQPRPVTIYSIDLIEADPPSNSYTIDIFCSKGTYIRTLCQDVGEALGCGAVLTKLRRTMACGFSTRDCVTLEQAEDIQGKGCLSDALIPVERVFASLPRLMISQAAARQFCNGVKLPLETLGLEVSEIVTVYTGDLFLGLGRPDHDKGLLRVERLFYLGRTDS